MPKRNATTELTDRNWDQEDEAEEAGTFNLANEEELRRRPTLKAKRTLNADGSRPGGSIFSGFSLKPGSTGTGLTFNTATLALSNSNGAVENSKMNGKDSKENPEYLRQLKMLNHSILAWIQKHVDENPYCILTPSFRDYERHLHGLEEKYRVRATGASEDGKKAGDSERPAASTFSSTAKGATGFSFAQSAPDTSDNTSMMEATSETTENKAPAFGGFSFGKSTNGSLLSQGGSTGGSTLGGTSSFGASGFSFARSAQKPFSFNSKASDVAAGSSQAQGTGEGADDEEYVPPKPEVREIKEDGAMYTKRCKLFYQKDGQWVDRGVGNLHLKLTDGGHTQLIVRADTNLGNILLNILLSPALPTKKQGKNNIFLVCIPNPPVNTKETTTSSSPVPMLIRVKTSEDADELLSKLEECKGSG